MPNLKHLKITLAKNADAHPSEWDVNKLQSQLHEGQVLGIKTVGMDHRDFVVDATDEYGIVVSYYDEGSKDDRSASGFQQTLWWETLRELHIY